MPIQFAQHVVGFVVIYIQLESLAVRCFGELIAFLRRELPLSEPYEIEIASTRERASTPYSSVD
jgi:hypothetical protein